MLDCLKFYFIYVVNVETKHDIVAPREFSISLSLVGSANMSSISIDFKAFKNVSHVAVFFEAYNLSNDIILGKYLESVWFCGL